MPPKEEKSMQKGRFKIVFGDLFQKMISETTST